MRVYKFAKIPVAVKTRGQAFGSKCKDYLVENEEPFFEIFATDEDLAYEKKQAEEGMEKRKGYLEYIALYRKFCEKALDYGVVLCHGSVVEVDGRAYLFSAPSGTGKSTHTRLWREYFGDRAIMINDDKPLLRFEHDGVYVYGTPWDGKHRISNNRHAKLAGICFLRQAETNTIRAIKEDEALLKLMNQIYRPRNSKGMQTTMEYVQKLIETVPMYEMGCTISKEAVELSYNTMKEV